ncbi:MAG: hypothetical protein GXO54_04955 [Chloroflexi bacterium]|nr:hypothetical protein [Chloroflexota bacterium]
MNEYGLTREDWEKLERFVYEYDIDDELAEYVKHQLEISNNWRQALADILRVEMLFYKYRPRSSIEENVIPGPFDLERGPGVKSRRHKTAESKNNNEIDILLSSLFPYTPREEAWEAIQTFAHELASTRPSASSRAAQSQSPKAAPGRVRYVARTTDARDVREIRARRKVVIHLAPKRPSVLRKPGRPRILIRLVRGVWHRLWQVISKGIPIFLPVITAINAVIVNWISFIGCRCAF